MLIKEKELENVIKENQVICGTIAEYNFKLFHFVICEVKIHTFINLKCKKYS